MYSKTLRKSPETSVLVKFELFWFNIKVSMLLILLKGCFVQYKTGDSEEKNEQLFLFHNHIRIMNSGYLESFV